VFTQQSFATAALGARTEKQIMRFSAGTLLLGIIAVLFGLLGAYIVRKELHKPAAASVQDKQDKIPTFTVPTASTDLEPGRKITLGDISLMKLTAAQMKQLGLTEAFMSSTKQIIGRVVKSGVKKGDTFDTTDFYPEGTGPSVAEKLKPGLRAVTVAVESDAAVAGFAIPGSMVDVLFRAEASPRDKNAEETTITLIEAAEVLALNHETVQGSRTDAKDAAGSSSKASVTLAVSPRQAAALRVVNGRGTLALALRGQDDNEIEAPLDPSPRTLDELLDRRNNKHKMDVYRGRQLSQVEFNNQERASLPIARLAGDQAGPKPTPPKSTLLNPTFPTSSPVDQNNN
jgi:pilus assembly protein CpaB